MHESAALVTDRCHAVCLLGADDIRLLQLLGERIPVLGLPLPGFPVGRHAVHKGDVALAVCNFEVE
ncbi:hypothetical protein [Paraburkholderia sp. SIMBA_030]|uniref:hypothetical protein n=1 Tax=Paraburkholderia sp. SIMBA_030 TaxID=3085773 RepID=UPI00397CD548